MKCEEIWKEIPGFDGFYEVSNMGRVKRTMFTNNITSFPKEHIMAINDNGYGYDIVHLSLGGERHVRYIHRLVAEAFCEKPDGCDVVDHINFDRKDNRASNLRWCTQKQNVEYALPRMIGRRRMTYKTSSGEHYIFLRPDGRYEVTVSKKYYGRYDTLEEAIKVRDEAIANG